jgi:hypothetical protein
VWRNGRAAWWVRNNGNKRKREPVIRDHATEDEDEEEGREVEREVEREVKRELKGLFNNRG